MASYLTHAVAIGEHVDIRFDDVWYAAMVREVRGDKLLIDYEGWDPYWSEWLPIDSPRIDTYRSKSVGDTSCRAMRHLFRPGPFCIDANLVYELEGLGFELSAAFAAAQLAENDRTRAIAILSGNSSV